MSVVVSIVMFVIPVADTVRLRDVSINRGAEEGGPVLLDSLASELSLVLVVVRPPVSPSRLHRMPRPVCTRLM